MSDFLGDTEEEIWKDIVDVVNFYNHEVSNKGRVRNKKTGTILKPRPSEWGYDQIALYYNSRHNMRYVHKLVAQTFIPNPYNKPKVNHIDGNKTNNCVSNLEWCTVSENNKHAYDTGLKIVSDNVRMSARKMAMNPKTRQAAYDRHPNIRIIETGDVFESNIEVAKYLDVNVQSVWSCLHDRGRSCNGYHFEYTNDPPNNYVGRNDEKQKQNNFLYPHQQEALTKMFNGCLLNGGTGSGKSRTGIYYFFQKNGGSMDGETYTPMKPNPPDLYILTTSKKRDDLEFEEELIPFLLYPDPKTKLTERYGNRVIIDSWQNIKKYADVTNAQFIFDENKISGTGTWAKTFLKITKNNEWIILSATNGDRWEDYETVFVAHGFFRNRSAFRREHLRYSQYVTKFPKVEGYYNEQYLMYLRDKLLINMEFKRHTTQIHEDVYCKYDASMYKDAVKKRWDPFKNEPITQASSLCYVLRKIVNSDESRQIELLELLEDHPRSIIFYNFDFELDILLNVAYQPGTTVAQYNGHKHEKLPDSERWVYLVQFTSGCEAWNTTSTDTIIFYSQNYSYKVLTQASGRIDRLTTPYNDLHYYHLKSRSPIDLAIAKALRDKKQFNEKKFTRWE